MFLNETKPPLDEALMHYGIKGMKWGQRRAERAEFRARTKAAKALEKEYDDEENYERRKKVLAGAALVGVGAVATGVILHRSGHLKIAKSAFDTYRNTQRMAGQAERDRAKNFARNARDSYRNSRVGNHSFRPENVGNPLWTRIPRDPKPSRSGPGRDFVDAGFGKDGVFNVTTMAKGSKRVNDFDDDIWDIPMLALTSGRK